MKKGTSRHPKTKKFARLLGVSRHEAIGILNDLWEWAGDYATDGAIGIHEDCDIADGVEYSGDPEKLIQCLINSGWVDLVENGSRFVIHDWIENCDQWVKKRLSRLNKASPTLSGQCPDNGVRRPDNGILGCRTGGKDKDKDKDRDKGKDKDKEKKGAKKTPSPEFLEAWLAYGRKGSRAESWKRWQSSNIPGQPELLKAIAEYQAAEPDPQFRKDFERFISGEMWHTNFENLKGNGNGNNGRKTGSDSATQRREERAAREYPEPDQIDIAF